MKNSNSNGDGLQESVAVASEGLPPASYFNTLGRLEAEYNQLSQLSLFVPLTVVEIDRMADIRTQVLALRKQFRESYA